MKKHLLAASLVLGSLSSFGAGYQLNLQGLRQLGMGGAGTAWPWDASTIFYNPGGLSRLKNIQVNASLLMIKPNTGYGYYTGSTNSVDQTFTPFNFYVGGTVKKDSRLGLGLGVYTPYGLGLKWDDNWRGRFLVQNIELQSIFIQPTVSYRISDVVSVGAGFIYATGRFDMQQALPVQFSDGSLGQASLHGNANGVGFNVGLQLKFSDRVQAGLTYRSQVNMDLGSGSATFRVPTSLSTSFPNTKFDAALPLPQVASVGIGVKPLNNDRLTLALDLNFTGWETYDSLRINFATQTSSLKNNHSPRHYRNTLTTRLGANYKISKTVSVMGGAAYDPSPVRDGYVSPELPDADRVVLTCGAAVKPMKRVTIMAAIEFTNSVKRKGTYDYGNFSGTYQTQAVTPGIGFYYNF